MLTKLTRRALLLLTATAPVSCAHRTATGTGTAPDRRDDADYWKAVSDQLHAQMFMITDQEIDEYRIALDDSWHELNWNTDVMVSVRFVPLRASAHDVIDPNSDIELAK